MIEQRPACEGSESREEYELCTLKRRHLHLLMRKQQLKIELRYLAEERKSDMVRIPRRSERWVLVAIRQQHVPISRSRQHALLKERQP
eukprot:scaffold24546_cov35-Tisochrysis_lutea.AAC.4